MEISLLELKELIGKSYDLPDQFSIKANEFVGKFVVVRSNLAGVFIGKLVSIKGSSVILENSFRLWRWSAVDGIGLSGVAKSGLRKDGSKIDLMAPTQIISDFVELVVSNSDAYEKVSKGGV
jgi:hypothetical protein